MYSPIILLSNFNFSNFHFIRGTRAVEAQFQIKAPDPYPLLKRRTDLGTLVVLSTIDSVTFIVGSLCDPVVVSGNDPKWRSK